MANTKQELYERVYASIGGDNVTYEYQMLLDMLSSFSTEEREMLDFDLVKKHLLYHVSMNELDLDFIYKFNRKLNLNLEEEIKAIITKKGSPKTIASYIGLNQLEDEEIIELSVTAIKNTLPEKEEELETLEALKRYLEEKRLYEDTITAIKATKDPETIVCAALVFEPQLIKDIFGSKKNMYLYLTANTFTDNENIEFYKERLLSMDNQALNRSLNNSAKRIDSKIKQKKF